MALCRRACLGAVLLLGFSDAQENTERETLTRFFETCNGDSWIRSSNWLDEDTSVCTWYGVTCDDDDNLVQLELRNNDLECGIPEEVFYLPSLEVFDVTGNNKVSVDFTDLDPSLVADLKQLYFADTLVESLKGIEILSDLKALGAGGTALTGDFPSQLFVLTELTTLDLTDNFLSGTLPEAIQTLVNLNFLFLSHNLLTGTLSNSIGALTDLSQLLISFNDLTGTLPVELTQLDRLTFLALNDQTMEEGDGFKGPMLDFAGAPNLLRVDVANNGLTGAVPSNLLQSVDPGISLINVDMSGNDFTGVIPAALSRFSALRLYLSGNSIQGIDSNLCSQDGWFFGDVGEFGCDGILCPPGSFNVFGRQISVGFPCERCTQSNFFGATKCAPSQDTDQGFGQDTDQGFGRHALDPEGSNVYQTVGDSASSDVGGYDTLLENISSNSLEEDDGDETAPDSKTFNFDFGSLRFSDEGPSKEISSNKETTESTGMQAAVTSGVEPPFGGAVVLLCFIAGMAPQW
eukprot:CAMPEP_0119010574 /NCGR_PEP_ID=MMETSP1176-20130426/5107_1 /TAXON_ID=265551 /ORGANISM="Synedropsis recta cf, Strain CCMP1620" /LENGTH=517 /DNA_ID=CAMNT_0006963259 /DNA_START=96 /DNA_END=1649 /DNA_ORIENTATION=-